MATKKSNSAGNKPGNKKVAKTRTTKSRATTAKVVPLQATTHSGTMSNGQTRARRRG